MLHTCEDTTKPFTELCKAVAGGRVRAMDISGPWPPRPLSDAAWNGPALGAARPGSPTPRAEADGAEGGREEGGREEIPAPPPPVDPKAAAPFGAIFAKREVATGPHMCLIIIG